MNTLSSEIAYLKTCPHYQFFAIDLFCGAGGESLGLEKASVDGIKCAKVFACVNHDPNAILSHMANFSDTLHYTEDIRTLDTSGLKEMSDVIRTYHPHAKIILHASLECTNFSNAKGGMPRDPDSRTLAEHLYRYVEEINPDYIQVENVREFESFGDLDFNGKPVSHDKGRLYIKWINKIKKYGYNYDRRILNSANFGAYTARERLFGIFSKKGLPYAFPEPEYSRTADKGLFDSFKPWRQVRDVLDLDDLGESIFNRKKPLVDATLKRIYAGLEKFVVKQNENTFLMKNFSGDDASKCQGLDRPAGTITCKDHHSVVTAQFLDNQYGTGQATSIDRPCCTIVNNPKQKLVSVEQYLMVSGYGWPTYSLDRPCPTVVATQAKSPIYLLNRINGGGITIEERDTEMMRKLKTFCIRNGISDIKMRMLNITELKRIMGFPDDYKLVGTQCEQKKFIGNAVEVNMSRCLCEALYKSVAYA